MMAETDMLVEKRFIRRIKEDNSVYYSVPKEVVNAVKENRVYAPAPIDHLTAEQLFDRMAEVFEETDKGSSCRTLICWLPPIHNSHSARQFNPMI